MNEKLRILAIIPARAGSKRLPGKNKKLLGGKPLISWTIEVLQGVPGICDVLVSTDDPEIADYCKSLGVMVPWLRPTALASDTSISAEVALHAVNWYEEAIATVDGILLAQPTSPFRSRHTVEQAINLFSEGNGLPVIGVSAVHHHPLWTMRVNNGILEPFFSDHGLDKRSQELDTAFIPNGVIYLFSPATLRLSGKIFAERNIPLIIPSGRESLDIDTEEDFFLAECYAKYRIARI